MKLDKALKKTWWVLVNEDGKVYDDVSPDLWPTVSSARRDCSVTEKPVAVRLVLKEGKP